MCLNLKACCTNCNSCICTTRRNRVKRIGLLSYILQCWKGRAGVQTNANQLGDLSKVLVISNLLSSLSSSTNGISKVCKTLMSLVAHYVMDIVLTWIPAHRIPYHNTADSLTKTAPGKRPLEKVTSRPESRVAPVLQGVR